MEELVRSAKGVGRWRLVDEEQFLTCLHRLRASLPDEIRKAMELQRESDRYLRAARQEAQRILEEAKKEAERILDHAQQEAERLLADTPILQQAQRRAQELLDAAQREAEEHRRAADEYVQQVLERLERFAHRLLEVTREGRKELASKPPSQEPVSS